MTVLYYAVDGQHLNGTVGARNISSKTVGKIQSCMACLARSVDYCCCPPGSGANANLAAAAGEEGVPPPAAAGAAAEHTASYNHA